MSYAAAMLLCQLKDLPRRTGGLPSTHLATLINSVKPPSHMTSGWRIAIARFSMSLRKPYLLVNGVFTSG